MAPAKTLSYTTRSPEETLALGAALGRSLAGGECLCLVGPLGAGKTMLVKGIARGNADAAPEVTSPTFTLIHEYAGRLMLYHIDAYRLRTPKELAVLGFEELLRPDAAVVVEWADRVRPLMPDDALWIELTPVDSASRDVRLTATGPRSAAILTRLPSALTT